MQSSEAVGHDSEGARKDRINGAGPGRNVQGGGSVGDITWKRDLGGEQGDTHGNDGVPPSGGTTDNGDDGETRGRRRVGVPIGSRGDGSRGDPPHRGVHQEASAVHRGEGGMPPRLCTVYGGGADSGDEPVGAMVVSRHGK